MSYCRLSNESDVSVYYSNNSALVCVHPEHSDGRKCPHFRDGKHNDTVEFRTYSEMIEHLRIHLNHRDKVPKKVISKLTGEQKLHGDYTGRYFGKL